ncbi:MULTISPECIES: hypothetical protein [Actinoplanes]|uniref:HAAS signaling domain-containing protein n=1 Tax=Actinoplanes TaxID=1865 RepID=UPI0005F2E003|nr:MULTISPECIES: hypothetical protein [Actinoplanes]GLY00636.1 hypothetical protein Acsp01_10150 [Actinoplanes sp. NBRC 101535]
MHTGTQEHTDTIVLDYLAALWAAGEDLPPAARDELMNTVARYTAVRRDLSGDAGQLLARLGPPEQLVEAVRRGNLPTHLRLPPSLAADAVAAGLTSGPAGAPPTPGPVAGGEPIALTLLLAITFVLPVVSPTAAMLLIAGSPRWTPEQKAAGWMLTTGSSFGAMLFVLLVAGVPLFSGLGVFLIYLAGCAGSVAAGLMLLTSMRRSGAHPA